MMYVVEQTELSKEGTRAVKTISSAMEWWDMARTTELPHINEKDLETGFIAFSAAKITLNSGHSWRWNRSAAVTDFLISPDAKISFQKLNSRSKRSGDKAPVYKCWLYTIDFSFKQKQPLYFVWCERGVPPAGVSLKDLSFLHPFVSDQLAMELKWK